MPFRYCLYIPGGGEGISERQSRWECREIPFLPIPKWNWPIPEEAGPSPDPWRELFQLAAIEELARGLTERVRAPLTSALSAAAKEVQGLAGPGVEVRFHSAGAKESA